MDKFLTYAGLQPIYLGDIDFMSKSVSDTFARVLKPFLRGADSAILSGCEISGGSSSQGKYRMQWTSGIVMLAGEILPIDAGSATGTAQGGFRFIIESTYDETGKRTLKSGSEVNCYEIRKATITGMTFTPGDSWEVTDIRTLDEIQAEFVRKCGTDEKVILDYIAPSETDVHLNMRIYKTGSSYYVSGTFEISASGNPEDMTFGPYVIDAEDKDNLLSATLNPGLTVFPITMYRAAGTDSKVFQVIPARLLVEDSPGEAGAVTFKLSVNAGFDRGIKGNFFTRLNTLKS